jgi:hypothetical protein
MKEQFTIQSCGDRRYLLFLVGKNASGEQFLFCPCNAEVVTVAFHPDGEFLGYQVRDLKEQFAILKSAPDAKEYDQQRSQSKGSARCDQLMYDTSYEWAAELGVTECPIQVHEFEIPAWRIAVLKYPDVLFEYKKTRDEWQDEELEEYLDTWETHGMFKLWIGRDYDMRRDGTVEST